MGSSLPTEGGSVRGCVEQGGGHLADGARVVFVENQLEDRLLGVSCRAEWQRLALGFAETVNVHLPPCNQPQSLVGCLGAVFAAVMSTGDQQPALHPSLTIAKLRPDGSVDARYVSFHGTGRLGGVDPHPEPVL
jgi:hypothetical protein